MVHNRKFSVGTRETGVQLTRASHVPREVAGLHHYDSIEFQAACRLWDMKKQPVAAKGVSVGAALVASPPSAVDRLDDEHWVYGDDGDGAAWVSPD